MCCYFFLPSINLHLWSACSNLLSLYKLCIFSILGCRSSLYILDISPLLDRLFIFLLFVSSLFSYLLFSMSLVFCSIYSFSCLSQFNFISLVVLSFPCHFLLNFCKLISTPSCCFHHLFSQFCVSCCETFGYNFYLLCGNIFLVGFLSSLIYFATLFYILKNGLFYWSWASCCASSSPPTPTPASSSSPSFHSFFFSLVIELVEFLDEQQLFAGDSHTCVWVGGHGHKQSQVSTTVQGFSPFLLPVQFHRAVWFLVQCHLLCFKEPGWVLQSFCLQFCAAQALYHRRRTDRALPLEALPSGSCTSWALPVLEAPSTSVPSALLPCTPSCSGRTLLILTGQQTLSAFRFWYKSNSWI